MNKLAGLLLLAVIPVVAQGTRPPYPPPGKLIDVGGYRVHLNCEGAGNLTVMIVGAGFSFDWGLVQPEAARFARVCTYDASGTAWSDPGPDPTCPQRVEEIHNLLKNAEIDGPRILVGLSLGAVIERVYASQYPSEVAGMVMIDHAFIPAGTGQMPQPSAAALGLDRLPVLISKTPVLASIEDDPNFSRLPEPNRALHRWAASLGSTALAPEACLAAADAVQKPLGDKPLVVISTTNESPGYAELQAKLLGLSRNSRQMIAEKSYHPIHIDQPELIVRAIQQVVEAVRNRPNAP